MPDSILLPITVDRLTDENGAILANGEVEFYDAGTSNPRTVYSDSGLSSAAGTSVTADDGGWIGARYTGTGAYKIIIKDSDGATIVTVDNLPGALDTSAFLTGSVLAETPVISKTGAYTIDDADQGKVINADPTGGGFTLTLPSAVTVGDGWRITVRHTGSANNVTVAASSGQTINSATNRVMTERFQAMTLVSDGANWHAADGAVPFPTGDLPNLTIIDRDLSAPPVSPTIGDRYILASAPSGAWSSYNEHDIVERTTSSAWIRIVPKEGWKAWVADENKDIRFNGTSWESATAGIVAADMPAGSVVQSAITEYTANASITSQIAWDDSIPQIGEGGEIISTTFTPTSATNKLRFTLVGQASISNNGTAVIGIFKNADADAIAADAFYVAAADIAENFILIKEVTAGSASSITFSVRAGPAAALTLRFNGRSDGRRLGGVASVVLKIEEIKV